MTMIFHLKTVKSFKIDLWHQEECLWNISSEGYHKKDLKANTSVSTLLTKGFMHNFNGEKATGKVKFHTKVASSVQ